MKKFLMLLIVFVLVIGGAYFGYQKLSGIYLPESVGTEENSEVVLAKDFTVKNIEGEDVKLSDYFGKPIVLNFWATWCGPCQMEMPDFDEAYQKYGEEIQFLMVNQTDGSKDTVESASAFIADAGYSFPIYFDTTLKAAVAYHVTSIPRTVFINADGTKMAEYKGMMSGETLQQYIDELLGM